MPTAETTIPCLNFQLHFTKAALAALTAGRSWDGKLRVSIVGDKKRDRLAAVIKERKARAFKVPDAAGDLIEFWNQHPYILKGVDAFVNRNCLTPEPKTVEQKRLLSRALDLSAPDEIKKWLVNYFDLCSEGQNVFGDGRPVAYKDLYGFLHKLVACVSSGESAWWMSGASGARVRDKNSETTNRLISAYKKRYGIGVERSFQEREYVAFARASAKVVDIQKLYGVDESVAFALLFEVMDEKFLPGKTVYPMHFGNTRFLNDALQQHLKVVFD